MIDGFLFTLGAIAALAFAVVALAFWRQMLLLALGLGILVLLGVGAIVIKQKIEADNAPTVEVTTTEAPAYPYGDALAPAPETETGSESDTVYTPEQAAADAKSAAEHPTPELDALHGPFHAQDDDASAADTERQNEPARLEAAIHGDPE